MGRPPSDRELKRMGRVMAGHQVDKDRQRWKRKVTGQAVPKQRPRKGSTEDEALESLDDPIEPEPPEGESP